MDTESSASWLLQNIYYIKGKYEMSDPTKMLAHAY